ncbi:MAG: 6-carboxytetrahydropterin synthase QueD [Deltaproteobacteria bacterium]|nr:6-carboxytetrahydropterin synthase QueD [Deltaproteobacteria bacterium]
MYELTVEVEFSAAHNLRNYEGACERLHGHNWRVEVSVSGPRLDERGMLVDFKVLKAELNNVLAKLDHVYLNEIDPFDRENPSAENIARHIFKQFSTVLNGPKLSLKSVRVWESSHASASYHE